MNFATFAFIVMTVFWGMTFPLIRVAVQTVSPSQFVFYRFGIALLLMVPVIIFKLRKATIPRGFGQLVIVGLILGVINWVSLQSQTIGLQYVESGRAAFLTGTYVVLVPFLSYLFGLGSAKPIDYFAALGALCGLFIFADPSTQGFCEGDLWILLCAFMYAVYIVVLQKWVTNDADPTMLAFFQLVGLFAGSGACVLVRSETFVPLNLAALAGILFCGIFATIGTTWIQARYQRETTPERVALIFSLEPVFAAAFGYLMLGEQLSLRAMLGCAVILGSIASAEYLKNAQSKAGHSLQQSQTQ